jgi:dihydroorotase
MNEQLLHLRNAHLIDPKNGLDACLDLFIVDGRIAAIGQPPTGFAAERQIDAKGLIACPGLVDLSTRLGGIETELAAAVAGGVTSLACPPDTKPPLDEPGLVERLVRRSETLGLARVYPIGALTQQLAGEKLAEMNSLTRAGCIGFSQAKHPIVDTQLLLRAMQYAATFGYKVRLRPQDQFLAREGVAHDGEVASRLGLTGIPVSAETVAIATALQLAAQTNVRLHLSRLSSAAGVALIRTARHAGMPVSCDVSIHHLHLSEMDIGYFDSNARFDPPLRASSDRDALRVAVRDGLAAICSDHTPVDADGKQLPFVGKQRQGLLGFIRIEAGQRVADMHDHVISDSDVIDECQRDLLADTGDVDHRLLAGQQIDDSTGQRETHGAGPPTGSPGAAARPRPDRPTGHHRWVAPGALRAAACPSLRAAPAVRASAPG